MFSENARHIVLKEGKVKSVNDSVLKFLRIGEDAFYM